MQFMPLQISPDYIPIHHLPRFLHIASIPAAVTIGIALFIFLKMKNKFTKIFISCFFITLIMSSLYLATIKSAFYRDCVKDQRWVWETVKDMEVEKIITDHEMRNYLMFRSGNQLHGKIQFPQKLPLHIEPGSIVIAGGARRPHLYPGYSSDWNRNQQNFDWELVS